MFYGKVDFNQGDRLKKKEKSDKSMFVIYIQAFDYRVILHHDNKIKKIMLIVV